MDTLLFVFFITPHKYTKRNHWTNKGEIRGQWSCNQVQTRLHICCISAIKVKSCEPPCSAEPSEKYVPLFLCCSETESFIILNILIHRFILQVMLQFCHFTITSFRRAKNFFSFNNPNKNFTCKTSIWIPILDNWKILHFVFRKLDANSFGGPLTVWLCLSRLHILIKVPV